MERIKLIKDVSKIFHRKYYLQNGLLRVTFWISQTENYDPNNALILLGILNPDLNMLALDTSVSIIPTSFTPIPFTPA